MKLIFFIIGFAWGNCDFKNINLDVTNGPLASCTIENERIYNTCLADGALFKSHQENIKLKYQLYVDVFDRELMMLMQTNGASNDWVNFKKRWMKKLNPQLLEIDERMGCHLSLGMGLHCKNYPMIDQISEYQQLREKELPLSKEILVGWLLSEQFMMSNVFLELTDFSIKQHLKYIEAKYKIVKLPLSKNIQEAKIEATAFINKLNISEKDLSRLDLYVHDARINYQNSMDQLLESSNLIENKYALISRWKSSVVEGKFKEAQALQIAICHHHQQDIERESVIEKAEMWGTGLAITTGFLTLAPLPMLLSRLMLYSSLILVNTISIEQLIDSYYMFNKYQIPVLLGQESFKKLQLEINKFQNALPYTIINLALLTPGAAFSAINKAKQLASNSNQLDQLLKYEVALINFSHAVNIIFAADAISHLKNEIKKF